MTVDLFHQLRDALEVLTIEENKKEYGNILDAKQLKKRKR
jgi:hypothetical protein